MLSVELRSPSLRSGSLRPTDNKTAGSQGKANKAKETGYEKKKV